MNLLNEKDWRRIAARYRREIEKWTVPFRERRKVQESHPVEDFLFVYYQYSTSKLEQWHPGVGTFIHGATDKDFDERQYTFDSHGGFCDPQKIKPKEANRLSWTVDLLRQTAERKANYACMGMHEWAMVYQGQEVRHEKTTGLRLPQAEVDRIVESRPINCTHFDAFRFFADAARPLNRHQPTMESRPDMEQPACIHANMDLYKWAFKAMPWIGSDLLRRCFDLAMSAREIDMRASPYDLSKYENMNPILIETAEGRLEYEQEQRQIADSAAPLRTELAARIEEVLNLAKTTRNQSPHANNG